MGNKPKNIIIFNNNFMFSFYLRDRNRFPVCSLILLGKRQNSVDFFRGVEDIFLIFIWHVIFSYVHCESFSSKPYIAQLAFLTQWIEFGIFYFMWPLVLYQISLSVTWVWTSLANLSTFVIVHEMLTKGCVCGEELHISMALLLWGQFSSFLCHLSSSLL